MNDDLDTHKVRVPPKLIPVFTAQDIFIRGAKGGRGSAKTRTFAKMMAVRGLMFAKAGRKGILLGVREYMNSLDDSSLAEIKEAIEDDPWLKSNYVVGDKQVYTKCGRIEFKFAGLHVNLDSIKSKARILICWADEAEAISEMAWAKLIPTIREEEAELWVTWNPEKDGSATDKRFWKVKSPDMIVVEMNFTDNPWFPKTLERTRLKDLNERPDDYPWIWEGGYRTAREGAYYAPALRLAIKQRRICRLSIDPLMAIRSYHDIGGAGAKADAYSIWITQFVDREIRILDHYTSQGQSLGYHVSWMRDQGYEKAEIILPHDGINANNVSGLTYKDHWEQAGFKSVRVIPNQGSGAAMMRIEASRRLFPRIWFDEDMTAAGRKSLNWYAPKIVERDGVKVDMGPNHDEYSHDADSFGLICVDYKEPKTSAPIPAVALGVA